MSGNNKHFETFSKNIKGKKVIIWGLGLNQGGLEAAKYFANTGSKVTVIDPKTRKELEESVEVLNNFSNVRFILGKQEEADFSGADLIIKNPAIPWELPLVKKLFKKNLRIETDVTLFFKFFRGKIVGVTGSKGKTTTTILISEFLKRGGKKILLGGNIKVSLFSYLTKQYLSDRKKIAVLELSSFQLEDLAFVGRSPDVAVVTNILRDHLNRYGTLRKYIEAKKPICLFQKKKNFLVLNRQDNNLQKFSNRSEAKTLYFSSTVIPSERSEPREPFQRFYLRDPLNNSRDNKRETRVMIKNPILLSKNNQSNISAALTVASIFKIKKNILEKVINNFKGVPYRMEKIAVIKRITFINDTAATIPDAAINNLKSFDKKVILIGGGSDKNLKFKSFAKTIAQKVKKLVLLPGNATPLIVKELKKYAPRLKRVEVGSMDKAVKTAYKSASAGDVILLSPGATSFGLFKNEFDRGDQFNEAVKKLK